MKTMYNFETETHKLKVTSLENRNEYYFHFETPKSYGTIYYKDEKEVYRQFKKLVTDYFSH